jgi:hypothetical protein
MGLEYVKGDKFEKGSEEKWPKPKAIGYQRQSAKSRPELKPQPG